MEQYGNTTTYNVESVLQKNIVNSEYFRDTCMKLSTWEEVVDEIFYSVSDVEPWMSGNARGASTAFCLLYRSVRRAPDEWPHITPAPSTLNAHLLCKRLLISVSCMQAYMDVYMFMNRNNYGCATGYSPWYLQSSKSRLLSITLIRPTSARYSLPRP